jgi:2-keto-3-deoxy-L-rhamnonate aldolase RhmA
MSVPSLRSRVLAGETVFGTLSLIPEPALPEIAGACGLDFYIADTEHVALDGQRLAHMIRAARSAGISPLVRVRHVEEKALLWTLDTGPDGIVIPLVEDAETVRLAHELTHFPPDGRRTLCSASRAAWHGARRGDAFIDYLRESNEKTLLVGLIETPKGIENLDAILAEQIDVVFVGRSDLSLKMLHTYAPRHPDVTEATHDIVDRTVTAGKAAAMLAYDVDDARYWLEAGCSVLIYSQPEMILSNHYREALQSLRGPGVCDIGQDRGTVRAGR